MKVQTLKKLKRFIKPIYKKWEQLLLYFRRKKTKFIFSIFPSLYSKDTKRVYTFCILIIKKTAYADMAIMNANSLHSLNPNHKFVFYCDDVCVEYLNNKKSMFDYPRQVQIVNKFGTADKAWQYYKIEVHIDSANNGWIDTDADGIWHDDPIIDRTKITMLAHAHNFCDMPNEVHTLQKLFPEYPEWIDNRHCVAAFLSMPTQFMNDEVAKKMRYINDGIFSSNLEFLPSDRERGEARRLSEEFAVNLAIQSSYPQEKLVVLKSEDGWGNKKILQSLYYGCGNKVNE